MTGVAVAPISGRDLIAATIVARGFAAERQRHMPELHAGIAVVGIGRVVLGDDEHHVVRRAADHELRQIKRLCVNGTIGRQHTEQTESSPT